MDGVEATTSAWRGDGDLTPLWQIDFPHSLGLYSAFTYFTGFASTRANTS